MIGAWIFLHVVGMAIWLGGLLTVGIWTSRARKTGDPGIVAFAYATAGRLYRGVISVSTWLTIVAGIVLMLLEHRAWFRPFPEHWLFQMQVLGLAAFLATVVYLVPNAGKLARLAELRAGGDESVEAEFERRVKRQAIVGSVVGLVIIYVVLMGALRF